MNSKVIEYAYSKIHEYEVEALAYKAKIAELEEEVQELTNQLISMHKKEVL